MDENTYSSAEYSSGGTSRGREARLRLLQMVAEGQISAEEAAERLSGLNPGEPPAPPEPFAPQPEVDVSPGHESGAASFTNGDEPQPDAVEMRAAPAQKGKPRWFRVRVTDTVTGRPKARISIPLGIVDWGLKVGARFNPEIQGIPLDELGNLLRSGQEGLLVDVLDEEDGEHVEIFIE